MLSMDWGVTQPLSFGSVVSVSFVLLEIISGATSARYHSQSSLPIALNKSRLTLNTSYFTNPRVVGSMREEVVSSVEE